jgi:hypothetical protein
MKKAIELLEEAKSGLIRFSRDQALVGVAMRALANVEDALVELRVPRYYTPEQWEAETGNPWPEKRAVYVRVYADKFPGFGIYSYADALRLVRMASAHTGIDVKYQIVCATEAGPPPDGWRPEEENQ